MAIVALALFIIVLVCAPSLARAAESGPGDEMASSRIPHEVLVSFRSGTDSAVRKEVLDSAGAEDVNAIPGLPLARRVELEPGQTITEAIDDLNEQSEVAWVQPNLVGHIAEIPDDPDFGRLWAFRNTGQSVNGTSGTPGADTSVEEAWDLTTGAGSRIAVVDTGIDPNSPDLESEIDTGLSRNFAASIETGKVDSADWADQNGHGTHVAGTIAAEGNNGIGVAGTSWNTDLIAVRACDFDGYCDTATVASALAYAGSVGARAVNVSLGFSGSVSDASAIRNAIAQYPDALYIVAAGNEDTNVEQTATWPCRLDLANVICVAATDQNDQLADFSNYGSTSVDLGAPGVNVLSTVPNIVRKTDDQLTSGLSAWSQSPSGTWNLGTLTNGDHYVRLNAPSAVTSATLTTEPLDFSGETSCSSTYYLSADLKTGQTLTQQYSTDGGTTWKSPGPYGTITSQGGIDDDDFYEMSSWLGAADDNSSVLVRFRYTNLNLLHAPTLEIAYPLVTCIGQQSAAGSYDVYSGTSMATPQVTGAAALLAGFESGLGTSAIRTALLSSVDSAGSLNGRTVTGGRLNVASALKLAVQYASQGTGNGNGNGTEGTGQSNDGDQEETGDRTSGAAKLRILSVKRQANGQARIKIHVSKAGRVWLKRTRQVKGEVRKVSSASALTIPVIAHGRSARRLGNHLTSRVHITVGYRPTGETNRFRSRWITLGRR